MIFLVSYKGRTKKSSMDSMTSYMIVVLNQRNLNNLSCVKLVGIKLMFGIKNCWGEVGGQKDGKDSTFY